MTELYQVGLGAALFLALPFGSSWLFAYAYVFFKPLEMEIISEQRVQEFRFAGGALGLIAATVITWWLTTWG